MTFSQEQALPAAPRCPAGSIVSQAVATRIALSPRMN